MSEEKEMTAPNVSIGVDTEQSSIKQTTNSISNRDVNFNPFDEFFKKIDPSYMKTVTMQELYQDIYSKKPPVIEGLLYQGTYLFVGSPKIGKSFFMALGRRFWSLAMRICLVNTRFIVFHLRA